MQLTLHSLTFQHSMQFCKSWYTVEHKSNFVSCNPRLVCHAEADWTHYNQQAKQERREKITRQIKPFFHINQGVFMTTTHLSNGGNMAGFKSHYMTSKWGVVHHKMNCIFYIFYARNSNKTRLWIKICSSMHTVNETTILCITIMWQKLLRSSGQSFHLNTFCWQGSIFVAVCWIRIL